MKDRAREFAKRKVVGIPSLLMSCYKISFITEFTLANLAPGPVYEMNNWWRRAAKALNKNSPGGSMKKFLTILRRSSDNSVIFIFRIMKMWFDNRVFLPRRGVSYIFPFFPWQLIYCKIFTYSHRFLYQPLPGKVTFLFAIIFGCYWVFK